MILRDLSEDDKIKFNEIHSCYRYTMLYAAKSILKDDDLAEDAVQESFIKLARYINRIGDVKSNKTRSFVHIIAKHVAIDIYRKRKHENCVYVEEFYEIESKNSVDTQVIKNLEVQEIVTMIIDMPELYREPLKLNLIYEIPPKEVADILNLNYELVKKRIQRGKSILREKLNSKDY